MLSAIMLNVVMLSVVAPLLMTVFFSFSSSKKLFLPKYLQLLLWLSSNDSFSNQCDTFCLKWNMQTNTNHEIQNHGVLTEGEASADTLDLLLNKAACFVKVASNIFKNKKELILYS
jgi:hypothetical protein